MERPDIDSTKDTIKRCCGMPPEVNYWCDTFGCEMVYELVQYIEYLEARLRERRKVPDDIMDGWGPE